MGFFLRQSRLQPKWELVRLACLLVSIVCSFVFGILMNMKHDLTCRSSNANATLTDDNWKLAKKQCWNFTTIGLGYVPMIMLGPIIIFLIWISWTNKKALKNAAATFNSATKTMCNVYSKSDLLYDDDFSMRVLKTNSSEPKSDVRRACVALTMNSPSFDPFVCYFRCCIYQGIVIAFYIGFAMRLYLVPTYGATLSRFFCSLTVDEGNSTVLESYECEVTPVVYPIFLAAFGAIHQLSCIVQLSILIYGLLKTHWDAKTTPKSQNKVTTLLLSFLKSARPREHLIIQRIVDHLYSENYKNKLRSQVNDILHRKDFELIDMWSHMFGETGTVITALIVHINQEGKLCKEWSSEDLRDVFKATDYSLEYNVAHVFAEQLKAKSNWQTLIDFLENSDLKQGIVHERPILESIKSLVDIQDNLDREDRSILYYAFLPDHFYGDVKFAAAKFLIKNHEVENLKVFTGKHELGLLEFLKSKYPKAQFAVIKRELHKSRLTWIKRGRKTVIAKSDCETMA